MKKALRLLTFAALLGTVITGVGTIPNLNSDLIPNVEAAGGSGGGNGGGTGGLGAWRQIYGAPGKQEAWNKFYAAAAKTSDYQYPGGFGGQWVINQVTRAGNNYGNSKLLSQCQNSRYIWYYSSSATPNAWYTLEAGTTHKASWIGSRNSSDWNDFLSWGGSNWNKGTTVIICSGSYEALTREVKTTEKKVVKDSVTLTGEYSGKSQLAPLATQDYNSYSAAERAEWAGSHETQSSPESKTSFATWYDKNLSNIKKLNTLTGTAYTKLRDQLEKEGKAAKTTTVPSPNITMSTKNRGGFSQGGIFNLQNASRPAKVVLSDQITQTRTKTQKQKMNASGSWVNNGSATYTAWKNDTSSAKNSSPSETELVSLSPNKFWQMINALCNETGMSGVKSSVSGIKDDSTVLSSKTMRTPVYTKMAQQPLGDPKNSTKVLKETAYDPFYKDMVSCPIDCVTDPSGASNNSDAKNNVQNSGTLNDGTYGVQGEVTNGSKTSVVSSNTFTFFRDNANHNIRFDIWYPKVSVANSGLTITSTKPVYTRIFWDKTGTPNSSIFTVSSNGKTLLTGEDIKKGKGYSTSGELNRIDVASSWASDNNKSHKVNINWTYQPTASNVVYTTVNGTGGASNKVTDTVKLRVSCDMKLNSMSKNKPTEVTTDTDSAIPALSEFKSAANYYAEVDFVRSGSALSN